MTRYKSPEPLHCRLCGHSFDPEYYNEREIEIDLYCPYCYRALNEYNDTDCYKNPAKMAEEMAGKTIANGGT